MDIEQQINEYFNSVVNTLKGLDRDDLMRFLEMVLETYHNDGTIFIFGNGGSAANASHICGDFVKGLSCGLDKRFKVICLNDNVPALMAIANDICYEDIFVEQLKNFLLKEDLVIGISGSGNSMNVVRALEYAKSIGAKTVTFCGFDGGKVKHMADLSIHVDINNMEVAEDIHLIVGHCVKNILMKELKKDNIPPCVN